jgi:hypothetical protein
MDHAQGFALRALDFLSNQIGGPHQRHGPGGLARGRRLLSHSRLRLRLILLRRGPLVLIRCPLVLIRRLFRCQSMGTQNSHQANGEKPPQNNFSLAHF